MEFVDSHAHLHFDKLLPEAGRILSEASDDGVTKIITVGCSLADSRQAVGFAAQHENVWAAVGAHPHDGADFIKDLAGSIKELRRLATQPKVMAVGEIGLDYYHTHSSKTDQQKALRPQIELALELKLPIAFHVRDAWDDFWPVFDSYSSIHGVVHSFSAHQPQLDQILERGLYVGLNGIMTFTKDRLQLQAAKALPLEKMLLETDAPFLTPAPYRGKVCESRHTAVTAKFLAHLRGEDLEHLAEVTTRNATDLFSLA